MHITKGPLERNLNTYIQLVTLASMIVGGIYIWVDKSRDIEDIQGWRVNHEQLHKERLAAMTAGDARADERMKSQEAEIRKVVSITENLTYRVTMNEQATSSVSSTVREVQNALAQQSGDLKVIKEILQRLEAGQRPRTSP